MYACSGDGPGTHVECHFITFFPEVASGHFEKTSHAVENVTDSSAVYAALCRADHHIDGHHLVSLATEPTEPGYMVGVYDGQRYRKYLNLFYRDSEEGIVSRDGTPVPWRLQFNPHHCAGWFSWAQVQSMLYEWLKSGKDVRWNQRITGV